MSFQAEEISIYNSSTNQSILTSENRRKVVPFSTLKCFNIGGANMVCVHVSSSDLNVITLTHSLLRYTTNLIKKFQYTRFINMFFKGKWKCLRRKDINMLQDFKY